MHKLSTTWFVIINPVSGSGISESAWGRINTSLCNTFDFVVCHTQYAHHATNILIDKCKEGYRCFLLIGGDGTLHDAVNGVMMQQTTNTTDIKLAFYSCGTGNDWYRTNSASNDISYFIDQFRKQRFRNVDCGKISFYKNTRNTDHYFINMAGVGFDAYVVQQMRGEKKNRFAYLFAMVKSLFTYNHIPIKITYDNNELICKSYTAIVALNKYAGGGMKLAPNALDDDGLFDVVVAKNLSVPEVLINTPRMYSGSYTSLRKVVSFRTAKLQVEVMENTENTYSQAEGELIGTGPFTFECIPKAIQILNLN